MRRHRAHYDVNVMCMFYRIPGHHGSYGLRSESLLSSTTEFYSVHHTRCAFPHRGHRVGSHVQGWRNKQTHADVSGKHGSQIDAFENAFSATLNLTKDTIVLTGIDDFTLGSTKL